MKIKELLELLLNRLENPYGFDEWNDGLCNMVDHIFWTGQITIEEHAKLWVYLHDHIPINFYRLFHPNLAGYWWKPYKKEPRIKYLKKLIKNL